MTAVSASISNVAQVAVGYYHTCVVTTDGAVECVGYNTYGQLGNGTTTNATTWQTAISSGAAGVACGNYHTCAIMTNGKAYCWGYNYWGQLGNGSSGTFTANPTPALVSGF
jgi:alpha-tubulin suppressor-like RCC1 family protein